MIKDFNDFKNDNFLNREREAMERELRFRKTKRNNIKYNLNINFDFIKTQILTLINKSDNYTLTIGSRVEEIENSKESRLHIEFECEELGRVRIFNPIDYSTIGHYEVNGDYYETEAKEIRDFYLLLKQILKNNNDQ